MHTAGEVTLFIDGGSVVGLYDSTTQPLFAELGKVTVRRASNVEPVSRLLRLLFHLLRVFGDSGKLADLSRKLPGSWRINMTPVGGPVLAEHYSNRAQAIAAEVAWFNDNGVSKSKQGE